MWQLPAACHAAAAPSAASQSGPPGRHAQRRAADTVHDSDRLKVSYSLMKQFTSKALSYSAIDVLALCA